MGITEEKRRTPFEIALGVDAEGMTTASNLYAFLTPSDTKKANYSKWIRKNIEENIFAEEGIDFTVYIPQYVDPQGGRPTRDYKLTSTFAKKLAMCSQTRRGQEVLEYFIRVELNIKGLANGKMAFKNPEELH